MNKQIFSTYEEASNLARELSIKHGQQIKVGRKGARFFVDVPVDTKKQNIKIIEDRKNEIIKKSTIKAKPAKSLSKEQVISKQSVKNRVNCSCKGEVEKCKFCFGKGYYYINGFGHKQ